ncbi:ABC transporter substrate-binding protein [Yinghuangia sp. ASG 101]|uniref:ABC transporter substrate-binding protein n=1 Tax=Yinghuangia sp. ASG 101 TaxID=2896848 RepID=UPI001E53DBA0|nr:ABC transporter substrate-binding protein [Yinghuangia sp. ASG 101]UGQ13335.1 ABC transporter substrate-binding protein [Yinghuangia sp. ASG 101]
MPALPPTRPRLFRPRRKPVLRAVALVCTAAFLAACGADSDSGSGSGGTVEVVVGYQSKTINTVTAGTLLRAQGYFEKRLAEAGAQSGTKYKVTWQDYDTGAPITTQMVAGKIDIGSMGDYPLLINGSRTQPLGDDRTVMVSVTGYNLRGGLNSVVVPKDSKAASLADLKGKSVSTSVGSAGHGVLVRALEQAGLGADAVKVENQQPQVGASALESGGVAAQSQFVAWPGLLVFQDRARLLYDGAATRFPTLHGVVVREKYAKGRPEVIDAFLKAQLDATRFLHEQPLKAARSVASDTGLPPEVVYLYNGPAGISTFDATLKPTLTDAMDRDIPLLKSIADLKALDMKAFVDDTWLRKAYGPEYDADLASTENPARITGTDAACTVPVTDEATAGEIWVDGEDATRPAANPVCLLRQVRQIQATGGKVRVGYVPDATTGTRWYADKAVWVSDPGAAPEARFVPFAAPDTAQAFVAAHPGSTVVPYAEAVNAA